MPSEIPLLLAIAGVTMDTCFYYYIPTRSAIVIHHEVIAFRVVIVMHRIEKPCCMYEKVWLILDSIF